MPLSGQVTETTIGAEIYLNSIGSEDVNLFNIDTYKWDIATNSEVLDQNYATSVTPTTPSAFNGYTLMDGYPTGGSGLGYGISGLTQNNTKIRVTNSGVYCNGGFFDVDTVHLATQIYNPGSDSTWTIQYSGTSAAYPMIYSGGNSTGAHLDLPGDFAFSCKTLPFGNLSPYLSFDVSTGFTIPSTTNPYNNNTGMFSQSSESNFNPDELKLMNRGLKVLGSYLNNPMNNALKYSSPGTLINQINYKGASNLYSPLLKLKTREKFTNPNDPDKYSHY